MSRQYRAVADQQTSKDGSSIGDGSRYICGMRSSGGSGGEDGGGGSGGSRGGEGGGRGGGGRDRGSGVSPGRRG